MVIRGFAGLIAGGATFLASYWAVLIVTGDGFTNDGLPTLIGAACGLLAGWAVSSHLTPGSLVWSTLRGGLVIGGIAFLVGFAGPIIVTPDANQGPLLGIFFTGPLGFIVGCIGGLVQGLAARRAVA